MELTLEIVEEGSGRTTEQTVETESGTSVKDLLSAADINPQTVIVERDGQIITSHDEVADDDDVLRVLDVISGG